MARILYLGDDFVHSTSTHRRQALGRLGHEVISFNPRAYIPPYRIISGLNVRTGFRLFAPIVGARLYKAIESKQTAAHFDLVWIDGCPELPVSFYRWLQSRGIPVVNYNVDDPFGTRDRRKWDLYLAAVPYHTLTVVVREENIAEAKQCGARQVRRVYRSYDPVAHKPLQLNEEDRRHWTSEVTFVGAWMPERGPFMSQLLEHGIQLAIWGDHWHKAPEWARLRACWRGAAVYGENYVKAIQCAKIALGLLSKGNRDLHTTRSAEIPFIGGAIFCAERTTEHSLLFKEGVEAVFWNNSDECAHLCNELLIQRTMFGPMATAARQRIISHQLSNDEVLQRCLENFSCGNRQLP